MLRDAQPVTGCKEYQQWTRRHLLEQARSTFARLVPAPAAVPRVVVSQDGFSRDVLLVVFLRGAMDGLTSVVPYGDSNLYAPGLRPNLAIQPPGEPNGAVALPGNDFFGLAPAMAPLLPAYEAENLAIVHATGSPDPTRSHFDAFRYMEYGIPEQPLTTFTGWLGRHLQVTPAATAGPLRGIAVSDLLPKTLVGAPATLPIADPSSFDFPGRAETSAERRSVLEEAYAQAGEPLAGTTQSTLDTIDLLATIDFDNYVPAPGAVYPETAFGNAVRSVAALVKAEVGVEVAMVERGGWDTHSQQVGPITNLMNDLSGALGAFHEDMQDQMDGLVVLVMSEFGRRADENGSSGTDHGHGNCMLVMGGHVAGRQVIADWTDGALLHPDLLYGGDSLQVTIDYRDIVAEILQNRLENTDLATTFPNYTPTFQGITI